MQLEFWESFKEYALSENTKLRLRKPRPQHWYDISIGFSDAHICLIMDTRDNMLRCEQYIPDSKNLFFKLQENKNKIEDELPNKLDWLELQGNKSSRITLRKEVDFEDSESWKDYQEWLLKQAELFYNVFPKYIKQNKQALSR